jgi:putative Holliday junction resolvase
MRIFGIDYGVRKIGIAVSDPLGWTAQGVETIFWYGKIEKPLERIKLLLQEYTPGKIVVGLPVNMNGTYGSKIEETEMFIQKLREITNLEIIKWDERLSTVMATKTMTFLGVKTSKKKGIVDQIAAQIILQNYLDSEYKQN